MQMPVKTVIEDRRISLPSLVANPNDRLRMGSISGATIMAPITTAVLFEIKPSVAIAAELTSSTKKLMDSFDASILL